VGAALGSAAGSIASLFGFKSEELQLVGAELEANRSAVILLVKTSEVQPVCSFLIRLGATVRHGSVSESLLNHALHEAVADTTEVEAADVAEVVQADEPSTSAKA
jgi:uncharacterized membrane protein